MCGIWFYPRTIPHATQRRFTLTSAHAWCDFAVLHFLPKCRHELIILEFLQIIQFLYSPNTLLAIYIQLFPCILTIAYSNSVLWACMQRHTVKYECFTYTKSHKSLMVVVFQHWWQFNIAITSGDNYVAGHRSICDDTIEAWWVLAKSLPIFPQFQLAPIILQIIPE